MRLRPGWRTGKEPMGGSLEPLQDAQMQWGLFEELWRALSYIDEIYSCNLALGLAVISFWCERPPLLKLCDWTWTGQTCLFIETNTKHTHTSQGQMPQYKWYIAITSRGRRG